MTHHLLLHSAITKRISLLIIAIALLLLIAPVAAQDIPTPNAVATEAATVEAAPIAILTQEPAPVAVDMGSGGGDVIINNGGAVTPPTQETSANTPSAPAATNDPVTIVIIVVLALLLVAALVFGGYITQWIAKLVPPETAASIFQSGVRLGLQMALNKAAETANTADDEFFIEMAKLRGYEVEILPGGGYEVKPATAKTATNWPAPPKASDA